MARCLRRRARLGSSPATSIVGCAALCLLLAFGQALDAGQTDGSTLQIPGGIDHLAEVLGRDMPAGPGALLVALIRVMHQSGEAPSQLLDPP